MKFRLFAIVAILFSIALANARRNKRRGPAAGVGSAKLNEKSADGAHINKHTNGKDVCDGKACPSDKNVCHKHTAMGGTTYECIPFATAHKRYPKIYNEKGELAKKSRRRRY